MKISRIFNLPYSFIIICYFIHFIQIYSSAQTSNFSKNKGRVGPDYTVPLLSSSRCISNSSDGRNYFNKNEESIDLSINRRIYQSLFYMDPQPGASVTLVCKLDSHKFSILKLQMGVTDAEIDKQPSMTVNIYQDGNVKYSYNLSYGEKFSTLIDLKDKNYSRPEDIAIELICNRTKQGSRPNYFDRTSCIINAIEASLWTQ